MHPCFRSSPQTKTKLDNQDAARAAGKITGDEIQLYFDRNLEALKSVISASKRIDHRLDFCIGKHFVNAGFFNV